MPRPTKGPRLGAGPTHQKMILSGLASQLIMHERIRTTETKAKRLRPVADRLITLGKDGSVHARRRALSVIEDREVVHKLFAEVAPRFAERNGGYTRVLKLGARQGDAAPMAIIELVEETQVAPRPASEQKRRRGLRRRKPAESGQSGETARAKASAPSPATTEEPQADESAAEQSPGPDAGASDRPQEPAPEAVESQPAPEAVESQPAPEQGEPGGPADNRS